MKIDQQIHLTYCTNIHPGDSWEEIFEQLKTYIPGIKEKVASNGPFGIGLRISNQASLDLQDEEALAAFRRWLDRNDCYVFTINGFPYGKFHGQAVKDKVHSPDWTTLERKEYTLRLFSILSELMPAEMDGGVSTSPLTYRHWYPESTDAICKMAANNLIKVVEYLYEIYKDGGRYMHLDLEPEPDGLLENSEEVITFFEEYLLLRGEKALSDKFGLTKAAAREVVLNHIQVCYDICHFAVAYEDHARAIEKFERYGIRIGKAHVSSALKVNFENADEGRLKNALSGFADSTYLHQVMGKGQKNELLRYTDLPEALEHVFKDQAGEWRIHYHVPVFEPSFPFLGSTQQDTLEVLKLIRNKNLTHHLEVETYTWEVLPDDLKTDLPDSISRELNWVKENF